MNNIRYACRSLIKAPLAALTIIVTIGLGLGLVVAVYTVLNTIVFSVDEVYNPYELAGIERQSEIAEPLRFTLPEYEALLSETDVFSDAFANTGDVDALIEGFAREGHLVTGNFFQVLGVSASLGRVFAPPDDEAGSPPVIVLSHRAWVQQYDSDPGVLDRRVRVNGTAFRVAGVTPKGFRGLEFGAAPDFWAPLAHVDIFAGPGAALGEQGAGGASGARLSVIGRLRSGLTPEQAAAQINAWDIRRSTEPPDTRRASLVLAPRLGTVPQPLEAMLAFMPLFFAFGLILLIGCANVANLLLARLVRRQREIGIRLAIGASRMRVIWQLLTENLLLTLIAAVLAFFISRAVLGGMVFGLTRSFPPEIGSLRVAAPDADWRVALFLFVAAALSTAFFALVPAFRATNLDVNRVIHGDAMHAGKPGRARDALVAIQVTGSVLLLICAAIFLRSAWSSATADPGIRTDDVVNVAIIDEARRPAILDAVRNEASVATVAASWPAGLGGLGGAPAYGEGSGGRSVLSYQYVSPEFFDVLGIDLLRGRSFTDAERDPDLPVAIVSESVARELWPDADPLGQVIRLEPDLTIGQADAPQSNAEAQSDNPLLSPRTAVVVGITRDVEGFQIVDSRLGNAGVYLPTDPEIAGTMLMTRVTGNLESARRTLVDRLAAIDLNLVEVSTLQTLANINSYILGMAFRLTMALGVLALLLTLSGLYSVLSYLVEQRTREIGVRMAIGANRRRIGGLVLWQSARPVGFGLLLGTLLTAGVGAALLATPVADQIAATVRLFDPIAYSASLVCVVAACVAAALIPALRAGRVNPLVALRED